MAETGFSKCLTATGWKKKTHEEIKESLVVYLKDVDPTFEEFAADIQNNLLDTAIPVIMEIQNMLGDVVNSYAPGYNNDFMWEQMASSVNLAYKDARNAQVTLLFSGTPGVYISKDTEVGAFKTSETVVVGSTGEVYVSAYAESEVEAPANTLTTISSTIDDSLTVTNPTAAIPFVDKETAEQLKNRAQKKLRNPRIGAIDYAEQAIKTVDGVVDRLVGFNMIQTATQQGIECIVGGGDDYELATVLAEAFLNLERLQSAPSDNEFDRRVEKKILFHGSSLAVEWTRPKKYDLAIALQLSFRGISVYKGRIEEVLLVKLQDIINNMQVGLPINQNLLNGALFEVLSEINIHKRYLQSSVWTITDTTTSNTLQWDTYGYLTAMKKDCYAELSGLTVTMVTA